MARFFRGHAHCIDGILDVDWEISPLEDLRILRDAKQLNLTYKDQMRQLAEHCLTRVDPDFPSKVRPGDFLIGNRGVGWGHDHDHAVLALKGLGLGAVLCETTTVNFRRNCINHGLPLFEVPGIFDQVKTGDELELDLNRGTLKNLISGIMFQFTTYPEFILEIIDAGGIYFQLCNKIE